MENKQGKFNDDDYTEEFGSIDTSEFNENANSTNAEISAVEVTTESDISDSETTSKNTTSSSTLSGQRFNSIDECPDLDPEENQKQREEAEQQLYIVISKYRDKLIGDT